MAVLQTRTGYIHGCRGLVLTPLLATGGMPVTPIRFGIRTAQSVDGTPVYEAGDRSALWGGDALLAVRIRNPVIIGLDLTFRNARMDARAVEIVGGGTRIEAGGATVGYNAPLMSAVARTPFLAEAFAENFLGQGVTHGFLRITFPFCIGRAPKPPVMTDNEWAIAELEVSVQENPVLAMPVYRWEFVDVLPAELT
ncbi:MAG: hypothetical protein DDT38_00991 [Firmicutes bacterium]|nr:hypothetical protein [candidate division NPL-UPA2 bacterium]